MRSWALPWPKEIGETLKKDLGPFQGHLIFLSAFYYYYLMKEKIKILFCPSDRQGVGHFRTIWPAQQIARKHSDEFEVSIEYEVDTNNIEYFSKFDIIHFHRSFG